MKKPDDKFRRQQEPENDLLFPGRKKEEDVQHSRRGALIILGLGAGTAFAEWKGRYVSQSVEVIKNYQTLNKLVEIKDYFQMNADSLAQSARTVRSRPWGAYREIKGVNAKLGEAIKALDDLLSSDIRFHPRLFEEAISTINKAVHELSTNSKIEDLHEYADSFSRSRRWTGTIDWLGSLKVDTSAVIALSRAVKSLKWYLIKVKKGMMAISDSSIEGYSNNYAVDYFIRRSM